MRIYGLTGGTGSGKSAAARRFVQRGIPVLDADKIGHELLEPGGGAYNEILAEFGEEVLTEGLIDRKKLGEKIFADDARRKRLNAIVHPMIFDAIGQRCAQLAREGHRAVMLDAALIAEGGSREPWLDGLVLITAPQEVRVARLVQTRGLTPEQARVRIAAQSEPESKAPLADWVVENAGTLDDLYAKIDAIAGEINAREP